MIRVPRATAMNDFNSGSRLFAAEDGLVARDPGGLRAGLANR